MELTKRQKEIVWEAALELHRASPGASPSDFPETVEKVEKAYLDLFEKEQAEE